MEQWMKKIEADKKSASAQLDLEKLYGIAVAEQWIEMNVRDQEKFHRKLSALGNILNATEYREAMKLSKEICRPSAFDLEKAKAAASCIARLAQSKTYTENVSEAGYKLLDKYKEPKIYQTDAFVTHSSIMMRLYEYLCELEKRFESD